MGLFCTLPSLVPSQDSKSTKVETLRELIKDGKLSLKTSDPAEAARVKELMEIRGERVVSSRANAEMARVLLEHFETEKNTLTIRSLQVEVQSKAGKTVSQGTLLSPERGWVLAPLDQIEVRNPTAFRIRFKDRYFKIQKSSTLSRPDNLALLEVGSLQALGPFPELKKTAELGIGTFVGAQQIDSRWVIGTVATDKYQVERRKESDPETHRAMEAHWKQLGLEVSLRREGYSAVYACDLPLHPKECGAPVLNVEGAILGIAIARADLHATYLLPIDHIESLLPKVAEAADPE